VAVMRRGLLLGAMLAMAGARGALAQADFTATRALSFSTFVAGAERVTGIAGAQNTDVAAGFDMTFLPRRGLAPALELRGSIPVMKGDVASEEEFLGGLRLGKRLGHGSGRAQVYGNALVGRGQLHYFGAGLQVPGQYVFYTESHSTVFSPGGGLEVDPGGGFGLKLDVQYERYATPVTASGGAWATVASVGVVYRLNFDGRRRGRE
jgi:hypothetical protein